MAKDITPQDAIADGQATARENLKAERAASTVADTNPLPEIVADAQDTARNNHRTDVKNQPDTDSSELRNDTSDKAKEDVAKSQLDPSGLDPISDKEVKASAHDADMDTGNKTAVSNKEAAKRAENPGEAEENAPLSTANPNSHAGEPADEDAAHPGTRTRRSARKS